ncbi:MAG: DNA mismatch repair protein MutS [Prevotellaceae bacterium]|jgi:DNA mismatch repair protein MutS|nr:DNA mismatch repair protein MutS [Prevotellaceae bacterium]
MSKYAETPLMKQYNSFKSQYPDAVLLFRVGDFYETFDTDAVRASEILGITLTKRANGSAQHVALAGFPHHAIDTYLPKLVRAGCRVAICDQLEDPKFAKTIVKRGITELVTPGVSINDNVLTVKENNFLCAVHLAKNMAGIAFLDISTGEFLLGEGATDYIEKLFNSFSPKEVLYERGKRKEFEQIFNTKISKYEQDDWVYTLEAANDRLYKQFEVKSLKGFGIENLNNGLVAAGAVLYYLDHTHHKQISHITKISRIEQERFVWLDKFTIRNLELLNSPNEDASTLFRVLDKTTTPMGSRLLRRWISFPLKDVKPINDRLSVVSHFLKFSENSAQIEECLANIGDLERILSKVAVGRISPREMAQLKNALTAIKPVKEICRNAQENWFLNSFGDQLNICQTLITKINNELRDNPPATIAKGDAIASGVSVELDELREISHSGKSYLTKIQQREAVKTGISSLKIAYNQVFGYYIEVTNTHKDKVPSDWIRKQTLTGAERYITEELKQYEEKILGAEEKIIALEQEIFNNLVLSVMEFIPAIQLNCNIIAQIDCLLSFAKVSVENRYFCPVVNDSKIIDIKKGRHPVIEKQLPAGEEYVPNDVFLDTDNQQIMIITGPNMAGKSALLRQSALITLLAQIGCYVPAESAAIGVVDRIFTRVGASDNISSGESTFMVEMNEAASILNNISDRSLILFDELGRGTSTYDGISIAWAIVEYIHENNACKAKTLFATHYHELNEMENSYSRIKNYNVSVKEVDNKVLFVRKLVRGGSEHSFGIHVAKMAGMPKSIVKRADEILLQLENATPQQEKIGKNLSRASEREGVQMSFFQLDDPVLSEIRDEILKIDINSLTPIDALNKLNSIKRILTGKSN